MAPALVSKLWLQSVSSCDRSRRKNTISDILGPFCECVASWYTSNAPFEDHPSATHRKPSALKGWILKAFILITSGDCSNYS